MEEPGKPRGRPFVKGDPRAGRPAGSKNGSTVCKVWADKFGFDFLMRVAMGNELFEETRVDSKGRTTVTKRSPYISERTMVAIYMVDRAYGKPKAALDVDINARITLAQLVEASRLDLDPPLPSIDVTPTA